MDRDSGTFVLTYLVRSDGSLGEKLFHVADLPLYPLKVRGEDKQGLSHALLAVTASLV